MADFYTRHHILAPSSSPEYRLKMRFTALRRLLVHLQAEMRSTLRAPLHRRIKAWRRGFTSTSHALYNLEAEAPGAYLPDFPDMNYRIQFPGSAAVNDKLNFTHCMRQAGIACPEILGVIDRGVVLHPVEGAGRCGLASWLPRLLELHAQVVFKPCFGGAGRGIFFARRQGGDFQVNGVAASLDAITGFLSAAGHYLALEFIQQAGYAASIYPRATNTLRILTVWDVDRHAPFIAAAAHRFGSEQSAPLDNFHGGGKKGGLSAAVGLESGELGPGVRLSGKGRRVVFDRHPDSGAKISGIRIPGWEKAKAQILAAARLFCCSPYIGWDLVATDRGACFLEGNSPPGAVVWQAHTPLLADPRVRRFFLHHKMIAPRSPA